MGECPPGLAAYDAAEWGPGDAGVRRWKAAALDWLGEDPANRLPVGRHGDVLDVLREAVRLLGWHRPALGAPVA